MRGPALRRLGIAAKNALIAILIAFATLMYNARAAAAPGAAVDLDRTATLGRTAIPDSALAARHDAQKAFTAAAGGSTQDEILFGDLHVHTTYSIDAFLRALPMNLGSSGATPPTDACNYARYVAQLDFFANTDHAEEITPENWRKTINALRLCAAVGARGIAPDLVPFLGFEWSQVGTTPATHWGHHNVIFEYLDEAHIPARPIRAPASDNEEIAGIDPLLFKNDTAEHQSFYEAYNQFAASLAGVAKCPPGSSLRRADCQEVANTPEQLLQKLKEWGFEHLVIPHGSTWGLYTPPKSSWDHELNARQYDPEIVKLIEVYSPHGNSELFRSFEEFTTDAEGQKTCPPPSTSYLPECWQAGEIIRARCAKVGESTLECERRAVEARADFLAMPGVTGWTVIPNSTPEEWLDAGQARDMFMPAFNYRPLKSIQYGLALTNFDDPNHPLRFKWGFIASTDNHSARPGSGFKQLDRERITDLWAGARNETVYQLNYKKQTDAEARFPQDRAISPAEVPLKDFLAPFELERLGSFLSMGGLVAVHAEGRSREAIWNALKARRVYGTSGVRILLDFDLANYMRPDGKSQIVPMGGEVSMARPPQFRVLATGSFKQQKGCPQFITAALNSIALGRLAGNECYYPTGERRRMDRIEVVRIRPQSEPNEDITRLIEDPWRVLPCPGHSTICRVQFSDPEFTRDSVYYVRALEEPSAAVNGKNLRTQFDENGEPIAIKLCRMDYRTNPADDCLSQAQQRAWSSPIYVNHVSSTRALER